MPKGASGVVYSGSKDTDKLGSGKPYESAVESGPMYDSRPAPKKGEDQGPENPGPNK